MKYLNILLACACEPWAMERNKLLTITEFLLFKAEGGTYSDEEIKARISDRQMAQTARQEGNVAVLPVFGALMQRASGMDEISGATSVERLGAAFRALVNDAQIKAIVLNFDSPGGGVTGIEEFASEIHAARGIKPIIAQIDSLAASAAYWLATQADEIVVTPGGSGGSIGVYAMHDDISKLLEKEGINRTLVSAGAHKTERSPFAPLSDEARAFLQKRVDETNTAFVRAVARGRGVSAKTVNDKFGQGRVFGASDLVSLGMADSIGTLQNTLERLGINGGVNKLRPATAQVRAAVAAGEAVPLSVAEDAQRECFGTSKSQSTLIVSHGWKEIALGDPEANNRSDSGEDENETARKAALEDLTKYARGFKIK